MQVFFTAIHLFAYNHRHLFSVVRSGFVRCSACFLSRSHRKTLFRVCFSVHWCDDCRSGGKWGHYTAMKNLVQTLCKNRYSIPYPNLILFRWITFGKPLVFCAFGSDFPLCENTKPATVGISTFFVTVP